MQWGMLYTVGTHYGVGMQYAVGMQYTVGMQYAVGTKSVKRSTMGVGTITFSAKRSNPCSGVHSMQ